MDKVERDELRAICEKATAGPWDDLELVGENGLRAAHPLNDGSGKTFQSAIVYCYGGNSKSNLLFCAAARTALPAALDALDAMEQQLPEGMKHCTIVFKECEKGHGWLTATNWVQHGCPTCERHALRAKLDAAEACIADLEAERDAAIATMEMATRTTEEIRRATVEAIVRRLRTIEESDPDVEWLTDLIEREFLTEKGGA